MIDFLTILRKTLNTVCLGTGSNPNSKQASSNCTVKYGYWLLTKASFSLGQLAYVHQWFLCFFAACISSATLTVAVSCRAENSAPDSMGINYQHPTTNYAWNITLPRFIHSSCLDFSCCGWMNFRFTPLFFLKYSWMWRDTREGEKKKD